MRQSFEYTLQVSERLDRFLQARIPDVTRSQISRWIQEGHVTLNGDPVTKPGARLAFGDRIVLDPPKAPAQVAGAVAMPLEIVYEDQYLAVVNKPAGIAVHGAPSIQEPTLVNGLQHHLDALSSVGGEDRPGIVHRLDKETSGLLVVAKTDAVHHQLAELFQSRRMVKIYKAVVYGRFREPEGEITIPIARSRTDRKKMAARRDGRPARTTYKVVEAMGMFSVVNVGLETGRTHQIRVHLTHVGHPLIGDKLYGVGRWKGVTDPKLRNFLRDFPRQALHSALLRFIHPVTREEIVCKRPFPPDLEALVTTLRTFAGGGSGDSGV